MPITENYDVIIVGAGAAGLFCAGQLSQAGLKVALVDNGKKLGRKILMSGGGKCNFTNYDVTASHYLSSNPHFVKSALASFTQWDFISLVDAAGITYHEKELGQLFCDEGAEQIVKMLEGFCLRGGVDIKLRQTITSISKIEQAGETLYSITVEGRDSIQFYAKSLVVATGGLSMPALGATPWGYQVAEQFGHKIIAPRASLVPFTYRQSDKVYAQLAGISLAATVSSHSGEQFTNQILFTHRGLSPAILQITNYWRTNESVIIDLLPNIEIAEFLLNLRIESPTMQLKTALCKTLPKRLVELWLSESKFNDKVLAQLSKSDLTSLTTLIHHWNFEPNGTEGYRTAEVTLGGISCEQISSKTMESKLSDNLYFIGEVLDVTGWLGGYNFQWAWSSAYAASVGILMRAS